MHGCRWRRKVSSWSMQTSVDKPRRIRILLVDDHTVVRAGYRRFLEQEPDCQVIAEAASGEEAYLLLQTVEPDIDPGSEHAGAGWPVGAAANEAALAVASGTGIQHARQPSLRGAGHESRSDGLHHQEQ